MRIVFARFILFATLIVTAAWLSTGCQSMYYNTMEKFGYQKREILVDRVKEARDEEKETAQQFASALEKFSAVINFKGGELEEKYEKLKAEFERCESRADAVKKRIAAVENVGEALFEEWEAELKQYTNANLRRTSRQKLVDTRRQYDRLIRSMKRAEAKIDPVLAVFRDQVLFLKHNLNARAIASIQNELVSVETDVAALIREMEASISEADGFIKTMASSN
ncbi:MAG: DUF2959 domain-containing protein [Desulfobacterales bacterium]